MEECLTLEELERVAQAPQDRPEASNRSHLELCPICRARLEEVRRNLAVFDAYRECPPDLLHREAESQPVAFASLGLPAGPARDETAHSDEIPSIQGYEVLEEVHRGAQGVIYRATQCATHRTVALKVLLHGPYASRRQERRFEREVELVAGLVHPNIVRLYDSGRANMRHWFAMEFIDGGLLREHLDAHRPGVRDVLILFVKICRAVAYAHARGVIHRDLKPGNILVDRNGEPHILDFGLAKPINSATDGLDTLATQAGEFFGTLAYASPEQASCNPQAVDVRTDVYALGMVLHEMLTGNSPYPTRGSMSEIIKNILEAEPRRPSRDNPDLDDDIDTIVQKALEKDADRRYQSVDALAADIDRYLEGRPIEAKPHGSYYILKKAVRRHKAAALLTGTLLASLFVIIAVIIVDIRRVGRERDRAVNAEMKARQAEALARKEAYEAQRTLYVNRISLANDAYLRRDIAKLRQMLEECPPRFRGWEWSRLDWLSDRSIVTFSHHMGRVYSATFSPDGKQVASGGSRGTVRVWDPLSGRELVNFKADDKPIKALGFSPDGRQLLSAGEEGKVCVWALPSGQKLMELPERAAWCAAFSPEGRTIVTATADSEIHLWRASDATLLFKVPASNLYLPAGAGFSPDGSRIVSVHDNGKTIREWDPNDGRPLASRENEWPVLSLAGKLFYPARAKGFHVATAPGGFYIVDDATGKTTTELLGHVGPIHHVDVSPDRKLIVTACEDGTCKVWEPSAVGNYRAWREGPTGVKYATFSPDGRRIATAAGNGTVKIWEMSKRSKPLRAIRAHESFVTSVAFSPDGKRLVSAPSGEGGRDLDLKVWDTSTGRQVSTLKGHTHNVSCVAFLPDGARIVSGSGDRSVRIWDAQSGRILHTGWQKDEVWDLAVSGDGRWIASGGKDATLYLWDGETGELALVRSGHTDTIDAMAFSPDGRNLVTGDNRGVLICWGIPGGQQLWTRNTEATEIYSALYTPDGKRILTGGKADISVWEAQTGQFVMSWRAHQRQVFSLSFSADGVNLLSSGNTDLTFKVWPSSPIR
jgi:WD40 repeat protein